MTEPAPILAAFSPEDVASAVVTALDPLWRAEFGSRARAWVDTQHHNDRMVRDHLAVYRRLLEGISMSQDERLLRERYEAIALTGDVATTARDYQLRELEIDFGLEHIRDGDRVLDVGCGPGAALLSYARQRKISAYGIDYAENMVAFAKRHLFEQGAGQEIEIKQASVLELPFADNSFDVVTSHRCLMALLDWKKQQSALVEIARVLKPGGMLILMEGTFDGIERLNNWRLRFGLSEIDAAGRDRLTTLKVSRIRASWLCRSDI